MILWVLLLASNLNAQSISTMTPVDQTVKINYLDQTLQNLLTGRPTITGLPTFQGGIKFSNTSGSALTFQDGTTQNTAPASGSLTINGMTDTITVATHTLSGSPNCTGFPCTILSISSAPSGNNYVSIAGLPAGAHLQIECSSCTWITGAALNWDLQVNGDAGANYTYFLDALNTSGIGAPVGATAANQCILTDTSVGGTSAGQTADFIIDIYTSTNGGGTGGAVMNKSELRHYDNTNGRYDMDTMLCVHTLVNTAINQVTFFNSGGTKLTYKTLTVRVIN